jgi:hypothetical protein
MRLVILALGLGLAACTPEHRAAQMKEDEATCRAIGARPGTDAMINCQLSFIAARAEQRRQSGQALQAVGIAMMTAGQPRARCTTTNTFGTLNTTCW